MLSTEGGLDLDMEKANSLQQDYVEQADFMLDASSRQIAQQAIALERFTQFEEQRQALDTTVADFALAAESTMAAREDRAKTLMQSGAATVDELNAILVETFDQSYPMVQGAYKLLAYMSLEADNQASAFQQRLWLQAAQGYRLTLEDTVKVAAGLNDKVDPSRKSGGALHRLHCFCLEFDGACEVQRRVPTDWVIEPINVSGYGSFSLAS